MLLHLTLYDQSSSTLSTCIHLITNLCDDSIEARASILCRPHYGLYMVYRMIAKWDSAWLSKGQNFHPMKKNIIEMFSRSSSLTKLVFIEHVFHTAYLLWSILMHNQITWRKSQKSKSICHKRKENSLNCPFQNQTFVTNLDIHKINICQRTV